MQKTFVATIMFLWLASCVFAASSLDTQNIASDEKIKVIVNLKENNGFSTASVAEELDDYDVVYVADSVKALTIEANASEIAELAKRGDVESIKKAYNFTLSLHDTVPLIGADKAGAMQLNNVNLTGKGQTICFIDSGVDYTHPDLGGCTTEEFLSGQCGKVVGGYAFWDNATADKNDIMDNLGHGTHSVGIAAANGGIRGVAPDAKVVMMKACDKQGGCDTLALIDSLNWCINNATKFNISVISMGLGFGQHNSQAACDNMDPAFTQAFAAATAKNISIAVATQNNGNLTGISYPACMSNATAVGATDKNDFMASYSNRNSLLSLVAPGTEITSTFATWYGIGNYVALTGTSMATPHVAGSLAILKQALASEGESKTPMELKVLLNETGQKIQDGTYEFTRINVYEALLALLNSNSTDNEDNETQEPIMLTGFAVNSPAQGETYNDSVEIDISVGNADTVNYSLNGAAFTGYTGPVAIEIPGNHTLTVRASTMDDFSQITIAFGIVNTTVIELPEENETENNESENESIETLEGFKINSPRNGFTYNDVVKINISAGNAEIVNYSLNNGEFVEYTGYTVISMPNGTHNLTVKASNDGDFNETSIMFHIINTTVIDEEEQNESNETGNNESESSNSSIMLLSPADGFNTVSNSADIMFSFEIDNNISSCDIRVNNVNIATLNASANVSIYNTSSNFGVGSYSWHVSCVAGNETVNSTTRTFSVTAPAAPAPEDDDDSGSSGGSGGSGGSYKQTTTFKVNSDDAENGYTKELSKQQKVEFIMLDNSTKHTLRLDALTSSNANISIVGTPIKFSMNVGEERQLNLTSDTAYDLYVKLDSIQNNKATVTIRTINVTFLRIADTEWNSTAVPEVIPLAAAPITGNIVNDANETETGLWNSSFIDKLQEMPSTIKSYLRNGFLAVFEKITGIFDRE